MRCYNGCPDSELQAKLDREADAEKRLKLRIPDAHLTYHHPHGNSQHGWHAHILGRSLSGYFPTKIQACEDAIARFERGETPW